MKCKFCLCEIKKPCFDLGNTAISNDLLNPKIESIIDFGDSVFTQTINDLAISCSYGIMNLNDPLSACCDIVNGYNAISKISDLAVL